MVEGTVENGADFGVFVELEPGLSGLIPISELGLEKDADPRAAFAPGQKLTLKLMGLDPDRRRISLSVRAFKRDQERQEYSGHMESGSDAAPEVTGFGAQLAAALDKGEARKATPPKKSAPAKKAAEAKKEPAAKKATTKKTTAKKTTAKKTTAKKPATKKATAKKTTTKKTAAKKAPAKKKTPAKNKTATKKAADKE